MKAYYRVDNQLRIVEVGGDWDQFATTNAADECVSHYVTGTSLLSYILGDSTRLWVEGVIRVTSSTGKVMQQQYRCDTPTERCYFSLEVKRSADKTITLSHELMRVEPMENRILTFPTQGDIAAIPRCSVCNSVDLGHGWCDPFELGTDLNLHVTYHVCERCRDGARPLPDTPDAA